MTFNSAVSVLCKLLYPDCKTSSASHNIICSRILLAIIFSNIFEKNGSNEIGRKLLGILASRLGFFKIGMTAACLKMEGNIPKQIEKLNI